MRILIVDNNIDRDSWGSPLLTRFGSMIPGSTVYVRRGPEEDLPQDLSRFDKVIVSGSKSSCLDDVPWIAKLEELYKKAMSQSKHVLGVCFGHQILARALSGKKIVRQAKEPEVGWTRIELLADSPLMEGLKQSFYTYSSHREELSELPPGARHLARSEACAIQAYQVGNQPVFGIQFHPEKDLEEAENIFSKCRKRGEPKNLLLPDHSKKLYDPRVGETIFGNFLKL